MHAIDLVIPWVDSSDHEWVRQKNQCFVEHGKPGEDAADRRFRDFGTLKYLFRGIEMFMPWVGNVFLVTCGQVPEWLDTQCGKLRLVRHSDYIPGKYLPTYNANTIELNLHRIEGLSEQFIYFNDDIFVLRPTKETDFFKRGLPCDSAVFDIATPDWWGEFRALIPLNDLEAINRNFDKRACMKDHWWKYCDLRYGKGVAAALLLAPWKRFSGFRNYHLPCSLTKSVLRELWEREPELLDQTCGHRFRDPSDVNIWLALYWQYATGQFVPRSPKLGCCKGLFDDTALNEQAYNHIRRQTTKVIVVNDNVQDGDASEIGQGLVAALESVLPNKSAFER